MQVIIRNMPDDLHRTIKVLAASQEKTMQVLLVEMLTEQAKTMEGRKVLR